MPLANQNLLMAIIKLVNVIYVAVGFFPVSGDFKKEIVSAKRKFDLTEKGKWGMFFILVTCQVKEPIVDIKMTETRENLV